jgi:ABC-type Mn2+/Zn2+ transport system ATPase subunit
MFDVRLLELIGPPGAGKSAILKALVESQQGEGAAIVLA